MSAIEVRFGRSFHPDEKTAVQELVDQFRSMEPDFLIFFCSAEYNLPVLGKTLKASFDCPAIGCTSAGEILGSEGYTENAIVCVAVASEKLAMQPFLIGNLRTFLNDPHLTETFSIPYRKFNFAFLLIDGLSMLEELVIGRIYRALKGIPLIGASAADGLAFEHTYVYYNGVFHENAAVLALFETSLPFLPIHIQHFVPTEKRLVITAADLVTRTVMEINGLPAVEEYARAVGVTVDKLAPRVFAAHPLMLKIGGEYYVRSIQKMNADGSLTFYCAIGIGIVLTVAKPSGGLIPNLEESLARIREIIPNPALILGSDCVLRRLEMQRYDELEEAKHVLSHYPIIGVSTYGEQFCGVHVNHTLTAMVIGNEA